MFIAQPRVTAKVIIPIGQCRIDMQKIVIMQCHIDRPVQSLQKIMNALLPALDVMQVDAGQLQLLQ